MVKARPRKVPKDAQDYTKDERASAWRAISKFNELKPQLTQFARSITGNRSVEIHATSKGPYTERNKIFLRPPLALGRDYRHDRNLCGSRGKDGRQSCSACRAREVVNFYLFHEIGHIWLGTQSEVTWDDRELARKFAYEWHPSDACDHADRIMQMVRISPEVMGIANSLNQYIGGFVNALEDARINEGMFDARPGLRQIFDVNIERLMDEGVEHNLGEMKLWKDAPADAQFSVALSIQAYGYDISEWFHPDVVTAVRDERLQSICEKARYASDVHEIFRLGLEAFVVAQELGFCLVPKCEVPPPPDPNDQDKDEDGIKDAEGAEGGAPAEGAGGSTGASPSGEDGAGESADADPASGADDPGSVCSDDAGTSGSSSSGDDHSEGLSNLGSPELAGSPSGNTGQHDDATDATDADGSQGNDREEESAGSSNESEVNDGQADNGSGQPEDERESTVPPVSQDRASESSGDSEDDSAAGSPLPNDNISDDGTSQNGDVTEGGDLDHGGEPEGDVELPDTDGSNGPSDVWEVEAPDHEDAPPVATLKPSLPEPGTAEEVNELLSPFLMHGLGELAGMIEDMLGESMAGSLNDVEVERYEFERFTTLIAIALSQVLYFDDPSMNVSGVDVAKFPCADISWKPNKNWRNFMPSENALGAAVLHARRVFEDNKRASLTRNKTSGRIKASVLGRRAPVADPRLFGKKIEPKKKSYLVIITGDCSASTNSFERNAKIKRMMFAQAEVLDRVGVPFVMMGHSASDVKIKDFKGSRHDNYWVYILPIKEENERWSDTCRERLAGMMPISENLDGHTLEYCRKLADKSNATDVIIIYYTDGEMPASNGTEEEKILRRELKLCKQKKYHTLAVGINTSSPERYGMKTVRVDSDDDIKLVIKQLEEELTHL